MKKRLKKLIPLIIFICVLTLLLYVILHFYSTGIPESASVQQVIDSLTDKGLNPNDVTDNAIANFQNAGLKTCLIAENDDFRFEFFDFDNSASALKVYGNAQTLIVTERLATPKIEIRNRKTGYDFYSLEAIGMYSVAIRVNHTAVYAYCDIENQTKLNQILDDIRYIEPVKEKYQPSWLFQIAILMAFLLYIPMAMTGRRWIWLAACASANASEEYMDENEMSRNERKKHMMEISSKKRITKAILLFYNIILVPEYVCVVLALISFGVPQLTELLNNLGIILPVFIIFSAITGNAIRKVEGKKNKSK